MLIQWPNLQLCEVHALKKSEVGALNIRLLPYVAPERPHVFFFNLLSFNDQALDNLSLDDPLFETFLAQNCDSGNSVIQSPLVS